MNVGNAQLHESGLIIEFIMKFKIGYGGFRIPSHSGLKSKPACINIQNDDNRCFMYAVQCGLYEIY